MKHLLLAATLLLSTSATAATYEQCKDLTAFAGALMTARQAGVSMDQVFEVAKEQGMDKSVDNMIILAYETPRYSTDSNKQGAINDFKSQILTACMSIEQ